MEPPLITPGWVLFRIDDYQRTVHRNTQITGPGASAVSLVTTSPTTIGDGEEGGAGEAGLEQFSAKYGLLVLEDVDEDAEGPDATMLDQLLMLAHDDPVWKEELRRYLQEEDREKKQIQKERAVRLAHWLEDVAVQPRRN